MPEITQAAADRLRAALDDPVPNEDREPRLNGIADAYRLGRVRDVLDVELDDLRE